MALRDLFVRRSGGQPAAAGTAPPGEFALRERARRNPESAGTRMRLGDALASRGECPAAAAEYQAAAELFAANDLYEKAAHAFDLAIRLDPARSDFGERRRKLEQAARTLERRDLQIARLARQDRAVASLTAVELRRFWAEIGTSPLATDLDDDALALLLETVEVQEWSARTVVVRQEQYLPRCYLVVEGELEVLVAGHGAPTRSTGRIVPGQVIGAGPLLDGVPWPTELRVPDRPATALRLAGRHLADHPAAARLIAALRRHDATADALH
jgi:tetratricopeptide (TPR) repeat protein